MPYKDKSDRYKNHAKIRAQNRSNLLEYLSNNPCVDCGQSNPIVLEFDHVKGQKSFNIGKAVAGSTRSWQTIQKEINKCEVRCANCHRIKTALQLGWYKDNEQ